MQLEESPLNRNSITPWYDSEIVCLFVLIFLFAVVVFALVGIEVADNNPAYRAYLWVPVILAVSAAGVIVSTTCRLIKRFMLRYSQKEL